MQVAYFGKHEFIAVFFVVIKIAHYQKTEREKYNIMPLSGSPVPMEMTKYA
jgi:hypothetical protein